MEDQQNEINALLQQVEELRQKQNDLQGELLTVKFHLKRLLATPIANETPTEKPVNQVIERVVTRPTVVVPTVQQEQTPEPSPIAKDWEKFIGENLSNKIGIAITVLGVVIGAKYAIDNDLISPTMRILLGYLLGLGLCFTAYRLRPKYEDLSAVILSGALASLYFLTYAAFSFYSLIPQSLSFAMMLGFTGFSIYAALSYNRQIIALGALMGAYGIPFLLSTGEHRPLVLFTYMAMVNIGILYLSTRKNWNLLYYTAFIFTWLSMISWALSGYPEKEFYPKLFFLFLFFCLFYAVFLWRKVVNQEKITWIDVTVLFINSFLYYGLSYGLLDNRQWEDILGLFTVGNALLHLAVAFYIYQKKLADQSIFYYIQGMFLVFLTIAIPIQLDGNWVTLLWVFEAALLFWIGRTKPEAKFYERISYFVFFLFGLSLLGDWGFFQDYEGYKPLLNSSFWSNVLCASALGFIVKTHFDYPLKDDTAFQNFFSKLLPLGLIGLSYVTFFLEINRTYLHQFYNSNRFFTSNDVLQDFDIQLFGEVWIINYTLLFVGILYFINKKYLKNRNLGTLINVLGVFALFSFLTFGLYTLGELKNSYQYRISSDLYHKSSFYLWFRYVSIPFTAIPLYAFYQNTKQKLSGFSNDILLHTILNISILWLLSSELIHWSELSQRYEQSYRLFLSLLWGTYALGLIFYGIKKNDVKHFRVGGMVLFAITLVKLFFFDLANLDTISKTIVLVILGLLLLFVSYLYNRYKDKF